MARPDPAQPERIGAFKGEADAKHPEAERIRLGLAEPRRGLKSANLHGEGKLTRAGSRYNWVVVIGEYPPLEMGITASDFKNVGGCVAGGCWVCGLGPPEGADNNINNALMSPLLHTSSEVVQLSISWGMVK